MLLTFNFHSTSPFNKRKPDEASGLSRSWSKLTFEKKVRNANAIFDILHLPIETGIGHEN